MKRLVVCADDYGFTPGVSRAIRELLSARRISATSVMTGSPHWPVEASALAAVAGDADVGLHVTLTDQTPIGPMPQLAPSGRLPPMPALYRAAVARRLPLDEIRAEIERQVDAFRTHWGAPPAHIDGHHHVHQLPGIRDIVVETARRLTDGPGSRKHPVWVRSCRERSTLIWRRGIAIGKALTLAAFAGGLERRARRAGVPVNRGFSGAYDYLADKRPPDLLFARFVLGAGDNSLMMCHPGYVDALLDGLDAMTTARETELSYLADAEWPALLEREGFTLGPLR